MHVTTLLWLQQVYFDTQALGCTVYKALLEVIDRESVFESFEMLSQPVQVTLICLVTLLKRGVLELEEPIRGNRVYVLKSPETADLAAVEHEHSWLVHSHCCHCLPVQTAD